MVKKIKSLKSTARLASILFLISAIFAPFSLIYIPSKIFVAGDAAATAERMLANEMLFRTSITVGVFSLVLFLFVALVLYKLFQNVDKNLAGIMSILVIVQIPIGFVLNIFSITSLMIFKVEILEGMSPDQRQSIALLLLKMSSNGNFILMTLWGLWLVPFGQLVIKSGFIPRILGIYLIINGLTYLVRSFSFLMFPEYKVVFGCWGKNKKA